jgi:hypothetical protein
MDSIKKLIDACRLHYEKLLLTIVLLILAGAVWYLNNLKADEEGKIQEFLRNIERGKGGLVKDVDLSANEGAQKLLTNPPPLNFSLPHHLFNPVKWQRRPPPDTTLIKLVTGDEVGWGKMSVTRITPLNFIIALQRVPTPGSYYIEVTHEGAARPADRKPKPRFATTNSALNEFFKLIEIKGPPEEPTGLVLELADGVTKTEIAKDKPFTKVEGYEADLKYSIDGKAFNNLRLNSHIRFQGEDYIVIAITANEVVVSARSNDKKYTVKQSAPP